MLPPLKAAKPIGKAIRPMGEIVSPENKFNMKKSFPQDSLERQTLAAGETAPLVSNKQILQRSTLRVPLLRDPDKCERGPHNATTKRASLPKTWVSEPGAMHTAPGGGTIGKRLGPGASEAPFCHPGDRGFDVRLPVLGVGETNILLEHVIADKVLKTKDAGSKPAASIKSTDSRVSRGLYVRSIDADGGEGPIVFVKRAYCMKFFWSFGHAPDVWKACDVNPKTHHDFNTHNQQKFWLVQAKRQFPDSVKAEEFVRFWWLWATFTVASGGVICPCSPSFEPREILKERLAKTSEAILIQAYHLYSHFVCPTVRRGPMEGRFYVTRLFAIVGATKPEKIEAMRDIRRVNAEWVMPSSSGPVVTPWSDMSDQLPAEPGLKTSVEATGTAVDASVLADRSKLPLTLKVERELKKVCVTVSNAKAIKRSVRHLPSLDEDSEDEDPEQKRIKPDADERVTMEEEEKALEEALGDWGGLGAPPVPMADSELGGKEDDDVPPLGALSLDSAGAARLGELVGDSIKVEKERALKRQKAEQEYLLQQMLDGTIPYFSGKKPAVAGPSAESKLLPPLSGEPATNPVRSYKVDTRPLKQDKPAPLGDMLGAADVVIRTIQDGKIHVAKETKPKVVKDAEYLTSTNAMKLIQHCDRKSGPKLAIRDYFEVYDGGVRWAVDASGVARRLPAGVFRNLPEDLQGIVADMQGEIDRARAEDEQQAGAEAEVRDMIVAPAAPTLVPYSGPVPVVSPHSTAFLAAEPLCDEALEENFCIYKFEDLPSLLRDDALRLMRLDPVHNFRLIRTYTNERRFKVAIKFISEEAVDMVDKRPFEQRNGEIRADAMSRKVRCRLSLLKLRSNDSFRTAYNSKCSCSPWRSTNDPRKSTVADWRPVYATTPLRERAVGSVFKTWNEFVLDAKDRSRLFTDREFCYSETMRLSVLNSLLDRTFEPAALGTVLSGIRRTAAVNLNPTRHEQLHTKLVCLVQFYSTRAQNGLDLKFPSLGAMVDGGSVSNS